MMMFVAIFADDVDRVFKPVSNQLETSVASAENLETLAKSLSVERAHIFF